jgi:hypothetical protein
MNGALAANDRLPLVLVFVTVVVLKVAIVPLATTTGTIVLTPSVFVEGAEFAITVA